MVWHTRSGGEIFHRLPLGKAKVNSRFALYAAIFPGCGDFKLSCGHLEKSPALGLTIRRKD
jgi:hypothetical protein